ncbi:hypothetical protein HDU96_002557 [Phlyctochytrium bullatum]|nr:hypothetical protein HDU96_002557 [Phlyctochytrium bullatum]
MRPQSPRLTGSSSITFTLLLLLLLSYIAIPTAADYISVGDYVAKTGHLPPEDKDFQYNSSSLPALLQDPQAFRYRLSRRPASGFGSPAQQYNVTWRVETGDVLHVVMSFYSPGPGSIDRGWIGLGFGSTMLSANVIICHLNPPTPKEGGHVRIHRHSEVDGYYASYSLEDSAPVNRIDGGFVDETGFCEWRVQLAAIPSSRNGSLIWAFQPKNLYNTAVKSYFTYHGNEDWARGTAKVDWRKGDLVPGTVVSFAMKQAHGLGMAAVWLIVFPSMVFYSRFFRSTLHWIKVHYTVQSIGALGVFAFLIVILLNYINWSHPHAIFGITLISLMVFQISLGVLNRLKFLRDSLRFLFKPIKAAHAVLGAMMMLGSIGQVYLGLQILYPWIEPRGKEFWYTFFAVVGFWLVAFLATEIYFTLRIRLQRVRYFNFASNDSKLRPKTPLPNPYQKKDSLWQQALATIGGHELAAEGGHKGAAGKNSVVPAGVLARLEGAQADKQHSQLLSAKTFTWADIAAEVAGGRLLVVANRRYVYDATKWINSHPGGTLVLYAVAGTDISFDFFRDSGFDAAEVTPIHQYASNTPRRALPAPPPTQNGASIAATLANGRTQRVLAEPIDMTDTFQHSLTAMDWRLIHRARRRNVHSLAAVQRLASYYVGELNDPLERSPDEYRRYAITAKELVSKGSGVWATSEGERSGNGFNISGGSARAAGRQGSRRSQSSTSSALGPSGGPIYKLRLCLLHPTPESFLEPVFVPGDTVELQARIGGEVVTRRYSPINGNPVAFEIIVRVKPGGLMSSWLAQQKVGERQVKVRGPMGTRLLSPSPSLPEGVPKDILFLAGGTGITPCLQIINCLLLPLHQSLKVIESYDPTAPDELELRPGDEVMPYHHFMDGWARGINRSTGQDGVFPLTLTRPPCRPDFKLTVIASVRSAADACGVEVLRAAELAYPEHIEIHWAVGVKLAGSAGGEGDSDMGPATFERNRDALMCGVVRKGTLDAGLLDAAWRLSRERRAREFAMLGVEESGNNPPLSAGTGSVSSFSLSGNSVSLPGGPGVRVSGAVVAVESSPRPSSNALGALDLGRAESNVTIVTPATPVGHGGGFFGEEGPLVIACGPEHYVQAAAAVVKGVPWLRPRNFVALGG